MEADLRARIRKKREIKRAHDSPLFWDGREKEWDW